MNSAIIFHSHAQNQLLNQLRNTYQLDNSNQEVTLQYISCLTQFQLKEELYYLGNKLSNETLKWFCFGCYYWVCGKLELSLKFLRKLIKKDNNIKDSWLLMGHILSLQEETEHALSSYRTAIRIDPQCKISLLSLSRELIKANNIYLAIHSLSHLKDVTNHDPFVLNELGVACFKIKKFIESIECFNQAIRIIQKDLHNSGKCPLEFMFNVAMSLRKMRKFEEAIVWLNRCLFQYPSNHKVLSALAFTYHLNKKFDLAIQYYHIALSLDTRSSFNNEMLSVALIDSKLY